MTPTGPAFAPLLQWRPLKAIILAGGRGTRLAPFTVNFPKPLMPLGDRPVIDVLIQSLAGQGITDITLTLGHLAELIRAYFEQRTDLLSRVSLHYVQEVEPTGTAGSLSLVTGLDETFLVMNGDLVTDIDYQELVRFHREHGTLLTIAVQQRSVKADFGILAVGPGDLVTDYLEKPQTTHTVSMGIYVYEPEVLKYIVPGAYLDFPDLVLRMLAQGEKIAAFPSDCQWLDIGRPADYARAQQLFSAAPDSVENV